MNPYLKVGDIVLYKQENSFSYIEVSKVTSIDNLSFTVEGTSEYHDINDIIKISPINIGDILITKGGDKVVKAVGYEIDEWNLPYSISPYFVYFVNDSDDTYKLSDILGYKNIKRKGSFTSSRTIITHVD